MKKSKNLEMWQSRLAANESAYSGEVARMDGREALYRGSDDITALVDNARKKKTPHVRNICAELIEAQVSSEIPQPKVTPRHKKDEQLAKVIEDMIRNELDRLPMEMLNDMMERTVPIQGGAAFLLEWDNTKRTHTTVGELKLAVMHPKQVVPQDGVYSGIEDMDYIIMKLPQTKKFIEAKYGVNVSDEGESEPDIKGSEGDGPSDDLVTQYVAFYRNDTGGIGRYSWVNDVELEDIQDYQARRLKRCKVCGALESEAEPLSNPTEDGSYPGGETEKRSGKVCPFCGGSKWEEANEDYEEVIYPITKRDGNVIPGVVMEEQPVVDEWGDELTDDMGNQIMQPVSVPTKIPYYKPDIYPILLQKNVSVYGRFLGDSDIDKIASQQNTTNRIEAKIIDKLLKSGSYITLPDSASIKVDEDDMKVIRPGNAADKALIGVYDLQGSIEQDMAYLQQVYEESRQVIGITDSFQGRTDRTATSGKAKEFAAAQSAGRLESKRRMKEATYAALFEAMFKFVLAYADEPRPIVTKDIHGDTVYDEFNRYDFLEQDAAGEWYWNTDFLFSCDTAAPLASNREAMWQETRMNFETGTFGNPQDINTLILFWEKMEALHYPSAGETKQHLKELQKRQMQEQQMMMQRQQAMQQQALQQARQDAMNNSRPPAAGRGIGG